MVGRLTQTSQEILLSVASRLGLMSLGRRLTRNHLVVVCYHGLTQGKSSDWLLRPAALFEKDVDFLARNFRVLALDQVLDELEGGELSTPTACITFDDGYRSNYTLGLPVLARLGVPATIYLATSVMARGETLWTTTVQKAVEQSHQTSLKIGHSLVDGPLGAGHRARVARGGEIREALKGRPDSERRELMEAMLAMLGKPTGLEAFTLMTNAELRSMDSTGLVSFGGHTQTHPILSSLSDDVLESEIAGCIDDLRGLKHISRTFAYPNGRPEDYDERAIAILRRLEIRAAATTRQWLHKPRACPYHMKRVVVGGGVSHEHFRASVCGLWELAKADQP